MSHMSSKDAHLYNQQQPASKSKSKQISSASSVAFSSTLSNLIKTASTDPSKPAPGRARPEKDDIFKSHNKGVNKRAAKDLEDSQFTQKHRKRTSDEVAEDEAHWKRTKRRMEEKARLYNALKRGDVEDVDDKYGVDFDRKWADKQDKGEADSGSSSSDSEASDEELVEYEDEFGRTRRGTRAEMFREERRKRTLAADEPDRFTARPSMPSNIIYGDTVQSEAFNPDETIAQKMADLAAKRDKELTPPPDEHFDGHKEARQRGVGFMHFSKDAKERQQQMENLAKMGRETDRVRQERNEKIEKRKEMIRERKRALQEKKKALQEKRDKGQADRFLDELGAELFGEKQEEKKEEEDGA